MPLILPGNVGSATAATGFNVSNSFRFNGTDSEFLSHGTGTATNTDKATLSFWVKRSTNLGSGQGVFAQDTDGNDKFVLLFGSDDQIDIFQETAGTVDINLVTNREFRDVAAWMHVVLAYDSSQGTAANRVKLYINGVQETSFSTAVYPSSNVDFRYNKNSITQEIGRYEGGNYFDGYLSEIVFIDGLQLAPDQFGEFDSDSGIWKPIDVSGLTFGNSGFYLQFKESGTSANSSGLGADTSGNTSHFTVSGDNVSSVMQSIDTCTNNFATMNGLLLSVSSLNFTQGDLTNNGNSSSTWRTMYSTIGVSAGKWYFEVRINKTKSSDPNNFIIGIQDAEQMFQAADTAEISSTSRGYGYRGNGGNKVNNTTGTGSSFGDAYGTAGDIVGCAVDLDNHKIYFSKGGTFQASGDPTTGSTGTGSAFDLTTGITYMFGISSYYDDDRHSFNFGSPPFAISSSNADGNGYGNFEYAVPSGYYALNTANLAEFG